MDQDTKDFILKYFNTGTWRKKYWMGKSLGKVPCDMIVQQELIYKLKPDTIVECGTGEGGSALFYYHCSVCAGKPAKVITIDIDANVGRANYEKIVFIDGDCLDLEVFNKVKSMVSGTTLVILDSTNQKEHASKQLKLYPSLVTLGSYIIMDDTAMGDIINIHRGLGPREAVEEFLKGNNEFEVDLECEKHLLTFNPGGYLRRVKWGN